MNKEVHRKQSKQISAEVDEQTKVKLAEFGQPKSA